jgi:hypothetical protein
MPLTGIRLLFEALVQCTRVMCKCEKQENGSRVCNNLDDFRRKPSEIAGREIWCIAKSPVCNAAMLDSASHAS